jgi:hypothetical protein
VVPSGMDHIDPPLPVVKLHDRGALWLSGFASTAGALVVLALMFLATRDSITVAREITIVRDLTVVQNAELLRLRSEVKLLESSESGRQCMITVAHGDYNDFLQQLGWLKIAAVHTNHEGLTGEGPK